jgi:hypothetical protein
MDVYERLIDNEGTMVKLAIEQELRDSLSQLAPEQQNQVLAYARSLVAGSRQGAPGSALLRFAGVMSREDAAALARAIEQDCEGIDPHGW